jgi:hypothetical protein
MGERKNVFHQFGIWAVTQVNVEEVKGYEYFLKAHMDYRSKVLEHLLIQGFFFI